MIVDCDDRDTSCYFTRRARRWFEARNNCTAENADLAVLTRGVYEQLRTWNVMRRRILYYIGLRRVYLRWTGPGPSKKLCMLTCKIHSLNRFSDIVELILNIFVRCSLLLYLRPDTQILRAWCNCVVGWLVTPPTTRLLTLDSRASLCLARLRLLAADGAVHPSIRTFCLVAQSAIITDWLRLSATVLSYNVLVFSTTFKRVQFPKDAVRDRLDTTH